MKREEKIETIDINKIKNPSFLKTLDYNQLATLCQDIRTEIIKETSLFGGHLSSNLGAVELTVALHRFFDFPKDKLIFDVGHQCYTHKILTGRSLNNLNKKGCVSGFQKMAESEYDCYEAGHSSTSLSAAEGFAIARDLKKDSYNVIAVIGDGSIVNGLAFEALNDIGCRNHKVIIVLNDNDMSISLPQGAFGRFFRKVSTARFYNRAKSHYKQALLRTAAGKRLYSWSYALKGAIKRKLVPINMFDNMGFTYMGPYDGHDIKAMEHAFKKAQNATKSVIIHVYTTKGKGYKYAEKDKTGYWHGVTPFDIETGQPKNLHPGEISWSHYFADLTDEIMASHKNTELIVPATLKGSGLEKSFADFPGRCLDVGIAEEHAVTLSGALALNGIHPILAIYSTFLQRAYDELSHDCARLKVNMTVLIDRAGLVGSNGETHQGIYDVGFLKTIPSVVVAMPSNQSEAKALYYQSLEKHGVFCIRYPRSFVSSEHDVLPVDMPFGRWRFLSVSKLKKACVIGVGPSALDLLRLFEIKRDEVTFVNPVYLNPIDPKDIEEISKYERIFIYDAYSTKEGFASSVESQLIESGYRGHVRSFCVPTAFIPHMSIQQQEEESSLLPEQVYDAIIASIFPKKNS